VRESCKNGIFGIFDGKLVIIMIIVIMIIVKIGKPVLYYGRTEARGAENGQRRGD
jgi:hypothetical protein